MSRSTLGAFLLLVSAGPAWSAPDPPAAPRPKENPAQKLRQQLAQPTANLERGIEPNTPLQDAIEFLASRYDVSILIDTKAFEAIGVQKVEELPVQLPRLTGVSLNLVLRKLLGQIHGDTASGTFLIRGHHVEVTTTLHANPRAWALERSLAPLVDADFDRVALDEALQELADQSGISIVVDHRAGEKARKALTARLGHTRLDTAVFLLADMADLQAVALESAIYVTSRENARALREELARTEAEAAKHKKKLLELRKQENPLVPKK